MRVEGTSPPLDSKLFCAGKALPMSMATAPLRALAPPSAVGVALLSPPTPRPLAGEAIIGLNTRDGTARLEAATLPTEDAVLPRRLAPRPSGDSVEDTGCASPSDSARCDLCTGKAGPASLPGPAPPANVRTWRPVSALALACRLLRRRAAASPKKLHTPSSRAPQMPPMTAPVMVPALGPLPSDVAPVPAAAPSAFVPPSAPALGLPPWPNPTTLPPPPAAPALPALLVAVCAAPSEGVGVTDGVVLRLGDRVRVIEGVMLGGVWLALRVGVMLGEALPEILGLGVSEADGQRGTTERSPEPPVTKGKGVDEGVGDGT